MYKRPSQRVKVHTSHIRESIPDDTFIGRIIQSKPALQYKFVKGPVYHQDDYLKLLEANYKKMGLPYVDPQLPIIQPRVYPEPPKEPELTFGDRIQVNLRVLKSGIVRVKINSAIAELYDKYYKNAKRPPFKMVLQAYKSHGFSKEYLQRIEKNNEKRKDLYIKIEKVFTKIFDKEPMKKIKKKKKEEEIIEPIEDDDQHLKPDEPEEEETLDVEPDEDEEEVENEEEYFSGGE
jgi:hypothetical protein|tara:strand:+ start:1979 stop:2680 length:702 start_codon:yes stop_codon:yes gene_type:complete